MRVIIASMLLSMSVPSVWAQTAPPATPAPADPAPVEKPVVLPVVERANEIAGAKLVEALRKGGYVLYMRHAEQIPPKSTECEPVNLTPVGAEQARKVGAALRELKIPIGPLLTSEPCRNLDTAKLLGLGKYEINQGLNPGGMPQGFNPGPPRTRLLATLPPAGSNALLVSHVHGSRDKSEWMHLELAEIIVYRPDGKGASTPVARVRVEGWEELKKVVQP
jgi:hypothetical protein